jgi:hypothetical protein
MKSKTNKRSNKRQKLRQKSRRVKGGAKHTSQHTMGRSAENFSRLKRLFQRIESSFHRLNRHSPGDVESIREIAENIAPTYVDDFHKDTLLDTLMTHARDYLNDPDTVNQYKQLIENTIERMQKAESIDLITDKTLRSAVYGLVPYHTHNAIKMEILNLLFDEYRKHEKRVDGLFMKELLEWAKSTNNHTVIERLFGQGYRIDDKVKTNPLTERHANESEDDYAIRKAQNDKYNELVTNLPIQQKTLDTVHAIKTKTGKWLDLDNVEDLYAYLKI